MIVSIKDSVKLFGISIMTCCAVTVCNMFLNYYLDLTAIAGLIDNPYAQMFYDAQIMTSKVVCAVSGGCLAITTVVMKGFSVFGLSVFLGCFVGYLLSFALMPQFYELQNKDGYLPELSIGYHWILFVLLVIAPTLVFALIAVCNSLCLASIY